MIRRTWTYTCSMRRFIRQYLLGVVRTTILGAVRTKKLCVVRTTVLGEVRTVPSNAAGVAAIGIAVVFPSATVLHIWKVT